MEFAVDRLSISVDHLESVTAVAIHEPVAIGSASVTKQERQLVHGLRPQSQKVPEHIRVLQV